MRKLANLIRDWWITDDKWLAVQGLLNTGKWWGVWSVLAFLVVAVYILLWQLVAPWVPATGPATGHDILLVSSVLAALVTLLLVDGLRRKLWRERQEAAEADSEPPAETALQGEAMAPTLPPLPSGPDARVTILDLDYTKWTDAIKSAVGGHPGKFTSFGELRQADPARMRSWISAPNLDLRHVMVAVEMQQRPSLTAARLVVYMRKDKTPSGITAKLTVHFDLSQTEPKATIVGGPENDEVTAKKVLDAVKKALIDNRLVKEAT